MVSILPVSFPDMLLVPGVALVAAMQNSSFTKIESWTYNSVMTTGNLRHFAETLFGGLIPVRDGKALREAGIFGAVCGCFFAGALVGAIVTPHMHNGAVWLPIGALSAAFYLCWG